MIYWLLSGGEKFRIQILNEKIHKLNFSDRQGKVGLLKPSILFRSSGYALKFLNILVRKAVLLRPLDDVAHVMLR